MTAKKKNTKPAAPVAPAESLNLRQTLEAFPGGLLKLAELSGVPYTNLRRMRDGAAKKIPWDAVRKLAEKNWADVPGCAGLDREALRAHLIVLFRQAQLERDALGGGPPHRKPGTKRRRVFA